MRKRLKYLAKSILLAAALYPALCLTSVFAQSAVLPPSNIECMKRLELPQYPSLPRSVRVEATETVRVVLSDNGSVARIETQFQVPDKSDDIRRSFSDAADNSIGRSRFVEGCAGKTVTLIFHFELNDRINDSFSFAYPK
jgi:hypothetical protein